MIGQRARKAGDPPQERFREPFGQGDMMSRGSDFFPRGIKLTCWAKDFQHMRWPISVVHFVWGTETDASKHHGQGLGLKQPNAAVLLTCGTHPGSGVFAAKG